MRQRLAQLGQGQRIIIFFMLFGGGLMGLIALTVFLILLSFNTAPRTLAVSLDERLLVTEFAALPDDDAYPRTVAVAPDGTVFTGSYATGTIWRIDPDKPLTANPQDGEANRLADAPFVRELFDTRELIGSVRGLAFAPDGTLYVLDGRDSDPRARGGTVWALDVVNERLTEIGGIDREPRPGDPDDAGTPITGFLAPNDIAVDAEGIIYVTDRGWREVWRIDPQTGASALWWRPTEPGAMPSGLAYDPFNDALIITDSEQNRVYRVRIADRAEEVLYAHTGPNPPGFDGVTVTPDGALMIAAIDQAGIVTLEDGAIRYIVGTIRGASDVASAPDGRLYLTNFDSRSLVLPGVSAQLPFALDVVRPAGG